MKRNQPIQKIDLGKEVLGFDHSETIFLVGRSKDCHIILDDKQVSREHLRIIHKNGKWFAEKTAEHNACLYNGEDFNRAELDDGDTLTIGSFTINVENSSAETVEFSAAPKEISSSAPVVPAPIPASNFDIDDSFLSDTASMSDINQEALNENLTFGTERSDYQIKKGEITSEIVIPQNLESFDPPAKSEDDEFVYEENNEMEAELALGLSHENLDDNNNAMIENDENMSYSLENIDNPSNNEVTKVMQSFSQVQLELFGEIAPYDKYLIETEKTYIGRDPNKCQIVLNDSEVSSVHAVITKNNIMLTLEDLNSSNGTILNGDRINRANLSHNDEFVIGGVTFTVRISSDYLKEESSTLMPVDENQTVEVEEVVEVEEGANEKFDALNQLMKDTPPEKSILKRIWKDEEKRKKLIYGMVILVGVWVLFGDDSPKAPVVAKKTKKSATKLEPIVNKVTGKNLNEEERRALSARYEIGKNHYYNGRYREALDEFQKISAVDPNFNSSLQSLMALSKEGLSKLEEQEKKRIAEQAAAEKKIKVRDLVAKAANFVKERRVELAQDLFNEIAKIDPENIEVTKMKLELEDWKNEKAKKELEAATKKKAREDKLEKLKPGKTLYLQKEWFKAIGKLEDFLKIKDMDEDLTKEASDMLKTSRDEISTAVAPLIGKAKSLMEGQDLKGAYEVYQQILKIEPSNAEALNATGDIKELLNNKARKIYREAIISESLSLFQDAKEKFQEVQQISPVDSSYYKKASDKLKDYLE